MIHIQRSTPILIAALLTLSACTSGASGTSSEPAGAAQADAVSTVAPSTTATPTGPVAAAVVVPDTVAAVETTEAGVTPADKPADQITNDGVLAAAVIIVSDGDLEAAIADGIVTEAEADAAIAALEAGTLSDYQN